MKRPCIISIFALILLFLAAGCAGSGKNDSRLAQLLASDSIPTEVKLVAKAIADGDSTAFARQVSYPLSRPYPLRDILTEAQMRAYFPVMIDDSIRTVVVNSLPSDWAEYGWRGWALDNGRYLWIDEKIYDVTYLSARESTLRDSLIKADMASVAPSLRKGWQPAFCLLGTADSTLFRVDRATAPGSPDFRLAVYRPGSPLSGVPAEIITGYSRTEGSAAVTTYCFTGASGEKLEYQSDIADGSSPAILYTPAGDSIPRIRVEVTPAYWLDFTKQ